MGHLRFVGIFWIMHVYKLGYQSYVYATKKLFIRSVEINFIQSYIIYGSLPKRVWPIV